MVDLTANNDKIKRLLHVALENIHHEKENAL